MIRLALVLFVLAGCSVFRVAPTVNPPPAAPPPAVVAAPVAAKPAAAPAPATGNHVVDAISNANPADVVTWVLPWLALLLTVAIVGVAVAAFWLKSLALANLAGALAVGLGAVLILKLVVWCLAVLLGLAVLGVLAYLIREVWLHRDALRKFDPAHPLLTIRSKV